MVWEPVLAESTGRAEAASTSIGGPNVLHYWDPERTSGQWFAENMPWDRRGVPAWDAFYLFDAEAVWTDMPDSLISWGYTIFADRETLALDLEQLYS